MDKGKVSESIFSEKVGVEKVVIPMAEVIGVEVDEYGHNIGIGKVRESYTIRFKNGSMKLKEFMGKKFMKAWCYYRFEIEGGESAFLSPSANEYCQARWKEGKTNVVCGSELPCPKHGSTFNVTERENES